MTSYTKHRLHVLDGMRGIAAIQVMVYHYYSDTHLSFLKNQFLAVDFFFILSGFVIFRAYGEQLRNGLAASQYLARRVSRLYPMMAIGLLLGLPALYGRAVADPANYTVRDILSTLTSNFSMLPYVQVQRPVAGHVSPYIGLFPGDAPLWSISFEMLASVSFLGLLRLRERQLRIFCIGTFSLLFIGAFFYGFTRYGRLFDMDRGWNYENFWGGFPRLFYGFSIGMLLYIWYSTAAPRRLEGLKISLSPLLLYGALVSMLAFPWFVEGLYALLVVSVIAPLLIWFGSLAACRDRPTVMASVFLGWISFPLYCFHVPVLAIVREIDSSLSFSGKYGLSPQLAAIAATIVLSITIGWIVDVLGIQQRLGALLGRGFDALAR
jgi:peptidoglycan/LPS O-acetylase OafA/YrhL